MHTKEVGDIAEIEVILASLKKGWSVSKPIGENQKYDIIIDNGTRLLRTQCKSGLLKNEIIKTSTARMARQNGKYAKLSYTVDEIDAIGIYCPQTDQTFLITVDGVSTPNGTIQQSINLRIKKDNSSNNQYTPRFAEDYIL
jgi:hypothetical protein